MIITWESYGEEEQKRLDIALIIFIPLFLVLFLYIIILNNKLMPSMYPFTVILFTISIILIMIFGKRNILITSIFFIIGSLALILAMFILLQYIPYANVFFFIFFLFGIIIFLMKRVNFIYSSQCIIDRPFNKNEQREIITILIKTINKNFPNYFFVSHKRDFSFFLKNSKGYQSFRISYLFDTEEKRYKIVMGPTFIPTIAYLRNYQLLQDIIITNLEKRMCEN